MKTSNSEMDRRGFLKVMGMGSLSLAMLPALEKASLGMEHSPDQVNFYFMAVSDAVVLDGVHHRMLMGGCGHVTPGNVVGKGNFQHQNATGPIPQQIFGEGTWQAKRLIHFSQIGTHGAVGVAGTLIMEVVLKPVTGGKIKAELEVVCNIPPAGLFTGKPEGYKLTVPGAPFGSFEPLGPPPLGITWFTNR